MVLALTCLLLMGCNSHEEAGVYPVRGEVFLNGNPAAGALVHFHPANADQGSPAYAQVQEDGSFELSTFGNEDGAEPGDYIVTLIWRDENKDDDGETIYGPDRFDGQYSAPAKSKLHTKVKPEDNHLDRFDLKS